MQNKVCKPKSAAFEMILDHLGVSSSEYHRVCYFEDSFKNLLAGKELFGFQTVFVSSPTLKHEGRTIEELLQFDAVVENKVGKSLKEQLPQVWEGSSVP
jgi:FMN phosphatase YigB (HAD superfamily)